MSQPEDWELVEMSMQNLWHIPATQEDFNRLLGPTWVAMCGMALGRGAAERLAANCPECFRLSALHGAYNGFSSSQDLAGRK